MSLWWRLLHNTGYFRMGHDPGGFRVWWRVLTGSDETLDNAHLMQPIIIATIAGLRLEVRSVCQRMVAQTRVYGRKWDQY
jgi:hypothetical protein